MSFWSLPLYPNPVPVDQVLGSACFPVQNLREAEGRPGWMAGERGFGPGQSWPSFGDLLVLLSLILVCEMQAPNHTVVLPLGTHSPREQGLASRATQWTADFDAQAWILVSPPYS